MKNINVAIIVVLALVFLGVGALLITRKSMSSVTDDNRATSTMEGVEVDEVGNIDTVSDRYLEYMPGIFASTKSTRRVLFFYANWCPICVPADENFRANIDKIPSDVTLIRVNYNDSDTDDAEKSLARKYDVTYQHTFIQIDGDDKVVTIWNGGQIGELLTNIK